MKTRWLKSVGKATSLHLRWSATRAIANPMSSIFISYRRDDTAPYAGRIYDRLTARFGEGEVFMDIDHIEPGEDFVEVINRKVSACDTAIILIGKNWLNATDAEGRRRLDDPEDFVRLEVAAALERKVRMVPVLVGGASMPRMPQLPEALALLARRNALEVSDTRFHGDVGRLIEVLEKSAGGQGASAHAPAAQTAAQPSPAASQPAPGVEASRAVPREGRSVNARWMLGAVVGLVVVMTVLAVVAKRGGKQAEPAAEVSRDRPGNVQSRTEVPTVPDRPVAASGEVAGTRAAPLVSDVTRMGGGRDVSGILAGAVSQGIPKQGLKEITDRANAGLAEAQFELGVINESAEPGNYAEAAKWYKLAASQGYPLADQGVQDALLLRDRGEKALENDLALKRRQSERLRARQAILGKRLNELNDKAMEAIRRIKGG